MKLVAHGFRDNGQAIDDALLQYPALLDLDYIKPDWRLPLV